MSDAIDHAIRALLDDTLARYGGQPVTMEIADVLVPVVERYAAQRAAEALRRAADELVDDTGLDLIGAWQLRDRADALAPEGKP